VKAVRERQQVFEIYGNGRTEKQPAEGGVSMGCSEDLASLLHTARYKCHHRLRLCTAMHPVDNRVQKKCTQMNISQIKSKGTLLTATAPANKLFCDVAGCHMHVSGVCVGNN
jgi:hypothetical protein